MMNDRAHEMLQGGRSKSTLHALGSAPIKLSGDTAN